MTIWEILDVEATDDKKTIKRAYSKKMKELDLEKDMWEFQQLKEAFDQALKQAEKGVPELTTEMFSAFSDPPVVIVPKEEPKADFTRQAEFFIENGNFFNDEKEWGKLLEYITESSLEEYVEAEIFIKDFLMNQFPYLSKPIIRLLLNFFSFTSDNKGAKTSSYSDQDPLAIKNYQEIQAAPNLDFSFALLIEKKQRKTYLYLRYELYRELQREQINYGAVKAIFKKAQGIYDQDNDLVSMYLFSLLLDRVERKRVMKESEKIKRLSLGTPTPNAKFLLVYIKVLEGKTISKDDLEELRRTENKTMLSSEQYNLLRGYVFLLGKSYTDVYDSWMQLSDLAFIDVQPKLSKLKKSLPLEKKAGLKKRISPDELDRKEIVVTTAVVLLIIGIMTLLIP